MFEEKTVGAPTSGKPRWTNSYPITVWPPDAHHLHDQKPTKAEKLRERNTMDPSWDPQDMTIEYRNVHNMSLVGGWPTPLKNMRQVSWDDYS